MNSPMGVTHVKTKFHLLYFSSGVYCLWVLFGDLIMQPTYVIVDI
jgi:hypothetical protein